MLQLIISNFAYLILSAIQWRKFLLCRSIWGLARCAGSLRNTKSPASTHALVFMPGLPINLCTNKHNHPGRNINKSIYYKHTFKEIWRERSACNPPIIIRQSLTNHKSMIGLWLNHHRFDDEVGLGEGRHISCVYIH